MAREPSAWAIDQAVGEWQRAKYTLIAADPTLEADEVGLADLMRNEDAKVRDIAVALCRVSVEADDTVEMIDRRMNELEQRRQKYINRRERTRATALKIIEALGYPTFREYDMTISKGQTKPGVAITEPALVPDRFCKIERTPRKATIGEALDRGEVVPGATKTNGTVYLRISTR